MSSESDSDQGNTALIKIGIHGAAGRMGRQLMAAVAERPGVVLGAAIDRQGEASIGIDAAVLVPELSQPAGASAQGPVKLVDNAADVIDQVDVLVDFSRPAPALLLLEQAVARHKPFLVGTTGFDEAGQAAIRQASLVIPVLQAANFSVGVTLMLSLLRDASKALSADFDMEVIEAHHRHKVDAPSGTALVMGQAIAEAAGRDLATCAVYGREGNTGERSRETIGFETIRGGDIIGEHTVLFAGDGERIELTHRATDRRVFARGAIRAAHWLADKPAGLYGMNDVLGIATRI